ncbi:hypothetical protein OUZ56_027834 [Daphnia magna]|uniref:Large ribosomal subunit protein uL29m n=1 Tax=Daphnia magna TaxID=35525 RepID=A0ABR0B229_9CRUS|nr:hypothetical protein OUZ56_027834 [Daphnia magna]
MFFGSAKTCPVVLKSAFAPWIPGDADVVIVLYQEISKQTFGLFSPSKCFRPANSTSIHMTSFKSSNLMQFFDDPKNFGASEVKSGRSWTVDELRIKSNIDLQKLWYMKLSTAEHK